MLQENFLQRRSTGKLPRLTGRPGEFLSARSHHGVTGEVEYLSGLPISSPAAIMRYAARNVYRRNTETRSSVVPRGMASSTGMDDRTTEFIRRILTCGHRYSKRVLRRLKEDDAQQAKDLADKTNAKT